MSFVFYWGGFGARVAGFPYPGCTRKARDGIWAIQASSLGTEGAAEKGCEMGQREV